MAEYDAAYYFDRKVAECQYARAGVLRPDQCQALAMIFMGARRPRAVVSIGCGIGVLEAALDALGLVCIGTDPSEAAARLYRGRHFHPCDVRAVPPFSADTWVFCESLEHLPADDIREVLPQLRGRIVVANDRHPINPHSWDHITAVDDDLFDWIGTLGTKVYRQDGYLAVDTGSPA